MTKKLWADDLMYLKFNNKLKNIKYEEVGSWEKLQEIFTWNCYKLEGKAKLKEYETLATLEVENDHLEELLKIRKYRKNARVGRPCVVGFGTGGCGKYSFFN